LFRIPQDSGIVVNYGLPNDGAERIAERLAANDAGTRLGINIVNTNRGPGAPPETDDAIIRDYASSVKKLAPLATYLVLNLSCPNTSDGRAFVSNRERVRRLLDAVRATEVSKPLFLKVAPFGDVRELEAFLEAVEGFEFVSGFSVNLPPGKPRGMSTPEPVLKSMPGAVSGRPCRAVALRAVRELYARMDRRRYCVIGSGGVFTGADAYEMIRAGASLVQSLTALIYRGPLVAQRICAELDALLARDGVVSVRELSQG
jgi:dihydroorotate dehydrogenase (fumarate)/dihydroorotate dehydrogenase